ncbi:MAG: hypothetical protein MK008_08285 [Bdellovibrionales bacterium]|nr:hypothetical protein [Bdellovibrionales bacterium]
MIIYVDETHYYENVTSGTEYVGTGVLIVNDTKVAKETVNHAFQLLRNDPDIKSKSTKKYDERTLTRNYFHACDDSKNGHSAICSSINKYLQAEFHYNYRKLGEDVERAYQNTFMYASIHVCSTKSPVKMYIENRTGFSKIRAKNIVNKIFNAIEWGTYEVPAIPKFFPEFEIEFVNKSNHGVQITDFIMWAQNRTRTIPPNKRWESRLKFSSKSAIGKIGDEIDQGDIILKRGVKHDLNLDHYPKDAFPLGEFKGNDHLFKLFLFIEYTVKNFLTKESELPHLRDLYEELKHQYEQNTIIYHTEIVRDIASCYIRIFDMKPVYTESDRTPEKFRELLLSKKLAGLTMRKDLMNGTMTAQFLARSLRNFYEPEKT